MSTEAKTQTLLMVVDSIDNQLDKLENIVNDLAVKLTDVLLPTKDDVTEKELKTESKVLKRSVLSVRLQGSEQTIRNIKSSVVKLTEQLDI